MTTRTAKAGIFSRRMIIAMVAMGIIALALGYFVHPVYAANFTPGQNGQPTSGENSDLNGGTATFTFEQNAELTCEGDTATGFSFNVIYDVSGAALPAGATLIVYLSPNQGAINNNAGDDAAGYIADVESNFVSVDVSGLSGTDSIPVDVPVTIAFQLSGGGVLGVFADEAGDGQTWSGKTNSLQCSEAESASESASVPELESASVPELESASVPASGEQSVKISTGTSEESTADSAFFGDGVNALPTIAFSLILLASLGALAYANVKSVRS